MQPENAQKAEPPDLSRDCRSKRIVEEQEIPQLGELTHLGWDAACPRTTHARMHTRTRKSVSKLDSPRTRSRQRPERSAAAAAAHAPVSLFRESWRSVNLASTPICVGMPPSSTSSTRSMIRKLSSRNEIDQADDTDNI